MGTSTSCVCEHSVPRRVAAVHVCAHTCRCCSSLNDSSYQGFYKMVIEPEDLR